MNNWFKIILIKIYKNLGPVNTLLIIILFVQSIYGVINEYIGHHFWPCEYGYGGGS